MEHYRQIVGRGCGLLALVLIPCFALAQDGSMDRYREFLQKKAAVDAEVTQQLKTLEDAFATETAPLVQQGAQLEQKLALLQAEYDQEVKVGVGNQVLNWVMSVVKANVAAPFFYLTVLLALLFVIFRKRDLFERFKVVIIVLAGLLVVFYSLDLFAQNHPYGEVIDGKLTTVNRLLNANEVDKTIVMIEEASGGVIEIPMPEVASDYLIPLDSFKKGTLKEAYTLGCLYLENNDSAKTLTLFLRVVRDFKVVAGEVPLLMNILRYFEEVNNPKAALETLLRISGSTSEQGVLLDHLSKLNLPPDQFQETLGLLLGRMKSATDFLKAAVFLNGLGRSTDASEMYRKAVATARDCKGFLGLADYAYRNGIEGEAIVAMEKAFKSARTTQDWVEYTQLAVAHGVDNSEMAWSKAVTSAKSIRDYVLLATFLNQRQDKTGAAEMLQASLTKKGAQEDLIDALKLAADLGNGPLVSAIVDAVLERSRKFEDFMTIAEVSRRLAPNKMSEAFKRAADAARRISHFQTLIRFAAAAQAKDLVPAVVENVEKRLRRVQDLLTLRKELVEKGFKSDVGRVNRAIIAKTGNISQLMSLFTELEAEGFRADAEAALSKVVTLTSRPRVLEDILKQALSKQMYFAAFDACRAVMRSNAGATVRDPKLLPQSEVVPNGPEVEMATYCAIIGHKAGRISESRDIIERHVAVYLDAYIQDPDSGLQGPVNTYFYLKILWELSGNQALVAKYEAIYDAVEARYLDEYRNEQAERVTGKELELAARRIELEETNTGLELRIQDLKAQLEAAKAASRKAAFQVFASFARILAVGLLFMIGVLVSVLEALRYIRQLSRFKTSGFLIKFNETFGFALCFTIALIPVGLLMVFGSQAFGMLLHLQQDNETEKLCERLDAAGGNDNWASPPVEPGQ
ncbi:MAG TPA: hypothetical protein PK329_06145 [Myxococcota bacterium]|nr:hypothetical protein [Myxococcota bacterium]HON24477.1 hypothetical protein [Myxococcota bacterium]HOS61851.1 hypothetical protein [Myxococcota bacterium]HPC91494.1 hypothetical protein [Myxococcota bacterium]HPL25247.1 hypothetical protein [Myxococcota bacterium]